MQTIKTGSCTSLSGRPSLIYHVGWLENKFYFRLHDNNSGGLFCKEWVSLDRLGIEEGKPTSSCSLQAIFNGKSANTGGFPLAVLLAEGLIQPVAGKIRHYKGCDPEPFKAAIKPLLAAALEIVPPKKRRKEVAA